MPQVIRRLPSPLFLLAVVTGYCAQAVAADMSARQVAVAIFKTPSGEQVDLTGKNLSELDLAGIDFKAALLARADLYGSVLSRANLTKTGVRSTTSKSTNVNYGSALAGASVTGGNTTTLSGEGEYTSVISAMSASGGSGSPSAGGNASYNATAQLPYGWWSQNFFLGNNTALLITANATVSAENTVGFDGVYSESAYSSLSLSISGAGPTGSGSQSFSDGISTGIWGWAGTDTQNRTMAAAFLNTSGGDLYGYLTMQANVSGSSSVVSTPVPEPETYAMMLAGLGALGFIGRRRKQQK